MRAGIKIFYLTGVSIFVCRCRTICIKFQLPLTTFTECMKIMTDHHIRHLPIMDKQNVIGLISIGDVVKEILEEQNRTIEQLKSYIVS